MIVNLPLRPNPAQASLSGYEVIGNVVQSGGEAIHCWRHSRGGTIADNMRLRDAAGRGVVKVNAPKGWQAPETPEQRNNRRVPGDAETLECGPGAGM